MRLQTIHQSRVPIRLGGKSLLHGGFALAIALLLLVGSSGMAGADMQMLGNEVSLVGLEPVNHADLDRARGGERTVINLSEITGAVEGNDLNAVNSTLGSTTVGGDSFQDFSGVSSIILNSGNNVSIQSSTTVNILID